MAGRGTGSKAGRDPVHDPYPSEGVRGAALRSTHGDYSPDRRISHTTLSEPVSGRGHNELKDRGYVIYSAVRRMMDYVLQAE